MVFVLFLLIIATNLGKNVVGLAILAFLGSLIIQSATLFVERDFFVNAASQIIEEAKDTIPLGVNPKDSKRKWPFLSALGLEDDPMSEPAIPEPIKEDIKENSLQKTAETTLINTHIDHPTASKTLQKLIAKVKQEENSIKSAEIPSDRTGSFLYCMNCGTRNNSINTYCHACGTSLQI